MSPYENVVRVENILKHCVTLASRKNSRNVWIMQPNPCRKTKFLIILCSEFIVAFYPFLIAILLLNVSFFFRIYFSQQWLTSPSRNQTSHKDDSFLLSWELHGVKEKSSPSNVTNFSIFFYKKWFFDFNFICLFPSPGMFFVLLCTDDFKPASIDLSNAILHHNADGSVVIKVPDGDVGNPLSLKTFIH